MNKLIPLIALAILLTNAVHAQIKRQYKDKKFAKQTVVIKESATQSDMDILNSQFNIDEIEVGEVIRITTESIPEKTSATVDSSEKENIKNKLPEIEIEQEVEVVETKKQKEITEPIQEEVNSKKEVPEISTSVKSIQRPAKKIKSKRKKPKFKKKKRKRTKSNLWRKKCYRF